MPVPPIVPEGDSLRRAVAWLAGQGAWTPSLIEEACRRFDVSPADEEFLLREFRSRQPAGRGGRVARSSDDGDPVTDELVAMVNAMPGWVKEMGIRILTASADEVTCEWQVSEKHQQAYGIVHGGVHCGVIETLASVGAAMVAHPRRQQVVGLENSTSFIRAVRSGTLRGVARPVTRGRSSQVWEAWIRDEQDRLVAQGKVRLLCVDATRDLG